MLIAHVIEHMDAGRGIALLKDVPALPAARWQGLLVCPQERGYASDPTHVRFTTGADLVELSTDVGLMPGEWFSFPFPRWAGKPFIYNEFCLLATKPLTQESCALRCIRRPR